MREVSPNPFCTPDPASYFKSLFQNILPASPCFSIFCPCPAMPWNRKSFGLNILEERDIKKLRYLPSPQNPGGRSPAAPNARSSARPAFTIVPSSNSLPISVTPCGTRRGGEKVGSGWLGSGAQSLRAFPTSTNPARSTSAGCPVKLVMVNISSRSEGTSSRSTSENSRAISSATLRRNRPACTKSTAERNRACRKIFGHASGTCALSSLSPPLSVSSSKAAAPSANKIRLSESYGQSGIDTSTGTIPTLRTTSTAARSTAVAGFSFIHLEKCPTRKPATLAPASKSSRLGTLARSPASGPEIACSTSIASSTLRVIGPSLSSDQHSVIAPVRATRPKVGRSPVVPHRIDGLTMLPSVSLPIAKPTNAAAVAAPGPALDPDDASSSSHGFIVCPPNQISFSASAPKLSLATSTAPAACSRFTTAASSVGTRLRNGSAPYVVAMPAVSSKSLPPQGMPCSGPRYFPAVISSSACFACFSANSRVSVITQCSLGSNSSSRFR